MAFEDDAGVVDPVVEGVDEGAKGLGVVAVIDEGVQDKVEAVEFEVRVGNGDADGVDGGVGAVGGAF